MSAPAPPTSGGPPEDSPRTWRAALPVFYRHASPWILSGAAALALAGRTALGGFSAWDLAPVAALVVLWPLQEWLIHVYILHFRPRVIAGRSLDFDVPRKHRAHHRDPWNLDILFIPLGSYAFSLPLLALLWWAVTPGPRLALMGLAAHLLGALHYEWVHFLVHTRVQPRTRLYRRLWRNHRLHHFKNEHYWYGVTRTGADHWLGTDPDPEVVPRSDTARTLGLPVA